MSDIKTKKAFMAAGVALLAAALAFQSWILLNAANVFKMTGFFQTMAIQLVGAKVDPRYSGGEILMKVRDRAMDDVGPGAYAYPLAEAFQDGRPLDLTAYTVHEPVDTRVAFMPDDYYWQLDFAMAALGPAVIHAYIDLDGAASGSLESPDGCDNVGFDPAHPWDYCVEIDVSGGKGRLSDAEGRYSKAIAVYVVKERGTVMARLPLSAPGMKRILAGGPSWHYVTVAAWDDYSRGHVLPIAERAGLRQGGGAGSRSAPRIYDCLVPKGENQAELLSGYDDGTGALATLMPVEVSKAAVESSGMGEAELAELQKRVDSDNEAESGKAVARCEETVERLAGKEPGTELAAAYISLGELDKGEACLDELLAKTPDDLAALSYKGLLVGMRAGRAKNVGQAVDLGNKGFEYLDRALAEAMKRGLGPDTCVVYENWINLASGVPEFPFGKSAGGAVLCEDLAAYFAKSAATDPQAAASHARFLLQAGILYDQAKLGAKAETCFMQVSAMPGIPAWVRLELGKRGYL
jgi:tetratricopeptide (TPR) repeat protein